MEAAGWRRMERMRTRNRSERWQILRGRTLVLMGVWMARMLDASELWKNEVNGGRLDSEVSVI